MAKSAQKLQARILRKQGLSLGEIAKIVGVSKDSTSHWCRDIALTEKQIQALLWRDVAGMKKGQLIVAEQRRTERQSRVEKYQLEAFQDVEQLSQRDLFMLGIGLYWAEGSKRNRQIVLSNTDPTLLKAFILFISYVCQKTSLEVKCRIQLNEAHKYRYEEVLQYWMSILDLEQSNFAKPTFIHVEHKKEYPNRNTYFGTLHVTYRKSTNNSYKLVGYINAVKYGIDALFARVA